MNWAGALLLWGAVTITGGARANAAGAGLGPSFKGPVGLQLYSLREQFKQDIPRTLAEVRGWGIKYVELAGTYGRSPEAFAAELKAHGLKPIAGHFGYDEFKKDPEGVARQAQTLGLKYAGCAWIPHDGPFNEAKCREAMAVFNQAGQTLRQHGMKFFYHVHGYEFEPHADGTLLDLLIQGTDPKSVTYEMDIFWVFFPNHDPVKLFQKYGKRWELVHLKDMRKGTVTGSLSGHTDVKNDAPLGAGLMDMPAILSAAKKAGVKWYFIEDESPWSETQIPQSLRYLEQARF